jgi:hypothetical protein
MSNHTRAEEIRMMSDPMLWPNLVLPIKRYDETGRMQTSLLRGDGPNVYHVNMWGLGDEEYRGKRWSELPHTAYASYEEIVDAGWIVD